MQRKYNPTSGEELQNLVNDEGIYLGDINTSDITDMNRLFQGSKRRDFSGLETWDTSNVENMCCMFDRAKYFNHDISSWDTSNVADMACMFSEAENFNQSLDNWDVSNVKYIFCIFQGAKSFNQTLDSWRISKSVNMKNMFESSGMQSLPSWFNKELQKIDGKYRPTTKETLKILLDDISINFDGDSDVFLGDIDTSAITDMSGLFKDIWLSEFDGIETWDTSKVKDMSHMFSGAKNFNQPLNSWNVGNVRLMMYMFNGATSFNQSLDKWDVSHVEDMKEIFRGAKSFNQDLSHWNLNRIEDSKTKEMIANLHNKKEKEDNQKKMQEALEPKQKAVQEATSQEAKKMVEQEAKPQKEMMQKIAPQKPKPTAQEIRKRRIIQTILAIVAFIAVLYFR